MLDEWKLTADHAMVVNKAGVEPIEEDKEEDNEVNVGEGSSTEDLAPK